MRVRVSFTVLTTDIGLLYLQNGVYELLSGSPVWMPEIGLGIGRSRDDHQGLTREWLYWFDQVDNRYPTPEEWGA